MFKEAAPAFNNDEIIRYRLQRQTVGVEIRELLNFNFRNLEQLPSRHWINISRTDVTTIDPDNIGKSGVMMLTIVFSIFEDALTI